MIEGHIHTPHIGARLETIDRQQKAVRTSLEQESQKGMPERFRAEGEAGYYPEAIFPKGIETPKTKRFQEIVSSFTNSLDAETADRIQKRLFDAIFINAYGRAFDRPNSASDFAGVVDSEEGGLVKQLKNRKYRNCVALVKVGDKLALAGGFNDIGEAMTQTIAREAQEEMSVQNVHHFTFFGERSNPTRDNRFVVVSSCAAGIINPSELKAGDDAKGVVLVPLIDKNGKLNTSFMQPGKTHKDVNGNEFTHEGLRADHEEILTALYNFWKDHNQKPGSKRPLSLSGVLKKMSHMVPQEWFQKYNAHPAGADTYQALEKEVSIHEGEKEQKKNLKMLLTPNIQFALSAVERIFQEAGIFDAKDKAEEFVLRCADPKVDILPLFPQANVTVDGLIVKGNSLVVQKMADGSYRLPGSFYSPEKDQAGQSLQGYARDTIASKFGGLDFHPHMFLGTVGGEVALGKQADPRYPRLSFVYLGTATGAYDKHPKNLPEGTEIVEIPIWADETKTRLSEEILSGKWGFDHNNEIVIPLLGGALDTLHASSTATPADRLIMQERLSS